MTNEKKITAKLRSFRMWLYFNSLQYFVAMYNSSIISLFAVAFVFSRIELILPILQTNFVMEVMGIYYINKPILAVLDQLAVNILVSFPVRLPVCLSNAAQQQTKRIPDFPVWRKFFRLPYLRDHLPTESTEFINQYGEKIHSKHRC